MTLLERMKYGIKGSTYDVMLLKLDVDQGFFFGFDEYPRVGCTMHNENAILFFVFFNQNLKLVT